MKIALLGYGKMEESWSKSPLSGSIKLFEGG